VVLIDTSVWIDFFQASESSHALALESLIRDNNRAMICGIVLQEVLQGIRDEKSYALTKDRLSKLPYLEIEKETYLYASSLYRVLRAKGITVPPVDVTLAGLAVQNNIPLYTRDEHFKAIARHSGLKLF
jgi:predicted nucleic acid-binding protein